MDSFLPTWNWHLVESTTVCLSCVMNICVWKWELRGRTIKLHSVAHLICNAKSRWLVSSLSLTVSSVLSGSHNKQPRQRRCCCQLPICFHCFVICFAARTTEGLLNLWVYWVQTFVPEFSKLPKITNIYLALNCISKGLKHLWLCCNTVFALAFFFCNCNTASYLKSRHSKRLQTNTDTSYGNEWN